MRSDTLPQLFLDVVRKYGFLAVCSALGFAAAFQVRSLWRELDMLREEHARRGPPPASVTAAGPGSGKLRQVWLSVPGTINPGANLKVFVVLEEVR